MTWGSVTFFGQSTNTYLANDEWVGHEDGHAARWASGSWLGFGIPWVIGGRGVCGNPLEEVEGAIYSTHAYEYCGWGTVPGSPPVFQ